METVHFIKIALFFLGYLTVIISLLPLLRSSIWIIRIFDYPRNQKFWINTIILFSFLAVIDLSIPHDRIFAILLALNELYLAVQIWSYTPFAKIQMKKNLKENNDTIRIMIANVFQENRDTGSCIELIRAHNPHIVLLVETDEYWTHSINAVMDDYPHRVLQPQNNTYGMIMFSKLAIDNHTVRFLVESDIPSICADIESPGGKLFRFYALHPKPPVPGESEDSTERDAEILIIGKEAKACPLPVIVAGDLNDVAWSFTTSLFLKVSGLLDPRIGRGFFNTFHAKYRLMRWPLDHVFCSSHFYLHRLKRLADIGSDHFPIFIDVALMNEEISENVEEKKEPNSSDLELAEEKIEAAK